MATRNEMEDRITNLDERLIRVEDKVVRLCDEIHGTSDRPGVFEQIRALREMGLMTQTAIQRANDSLDVLKADRWVLRGIVIAISVGGALIGWVLNFALGLTK